MQQEQSSAQNISGDAFGGLTGQYAPRRRVRVRSALDGSARQVAGSRSPDPCIVDLMRAVWLLVVAGCGRVGFEDPVGDGGGGGGGDGRGSDAYHIIDSSFPLDDIVGTQTGNLVFVTSAQYVPGSLGGLAQADAICNMHANAAGITGTFVAWLSTSSKNASARLGNARGWVRRDGLPFADQVADIVAGHIYYPILLDENGVAHGRDAVATGTNVDGTAATGYTCTDYTSATTARRLVYGIVNAGTQAWTSGGFVACNTPFRLYCFQTDLSSPVVAPLGTARKAFEGSADWPSSSTLPVADQMCADDAQAAGLSGTFHALLATVGTTAVSRFTIGVPWSRVDGAIVTADFSSQLAAVDVAADGTYLADVYAWLGAPTAFEAGTADTTCQNWTSTASVDHGDIGYVGETGGIFGSNTICNTGGTRVLCFQD